MPRDFTDKDLEDIGWDLVDRMLAMSRPQPTQEQPDMGMRLQGMRQASLRWSTARGLRGGQPAPGGQRLGIPGILPAMPKIPKIEGGDHGNRP